MARVLSLLLIVMLNAAVFCKPVDNEVENTEIKEIYTAGVSSGHSLWKRFVNPAFTFGNQPDTGLGKMRMKRSAAEDCEKLNLCKLHAHSRSNFISAFELYFVNKENAKLWDHRARSVAACEQRFSCDYRRR